MLMAKDAEARSARPKHGAPVRIAARAPGSIVECAKYPVMMNDWDRATH